MGAIGSIDLAEIFDIERLEKEYYFFLEKGKIMIFSNAQIEFLKSYPKTAAQCNGRCVRRFSEAFREILIEMKLEKLMSTKGKLKINRLRHPSGVVFFMHPKTNEKISVFEGENFKPNKTTIGRCVDIASDEGQELVKALIERTSGYADSFEVETVAETAPETEAPETVAPETVAPETATAPENEIPTETKKRK